MRPKDLHAKALEIVLRFNPIDFVVVESANRNGRYYDKKKKKWMLLPFWTFESMGRAQQAVSDATPSPRYGTFITAKWKGNKDKDHSIKRAMAITRNPFEEEICHDEAEAIGLMDHFFTQARLQKARRRL